MSEKIEQMFGADGKKSETIQFVPDKEKGKPIYTANPMVKMFATGIAAGVALSWAFSLLFNSDSKK